VTGDTDRAGGNRASGRGLRRFVTAEKTLGGQPLGVLKRFTEPRQAPQVGEACEMCGASIPTEHAHVVNIVSRNLMCACRACYLLFTHEGAAQGKYRAVPTRYLHDPDFTISNAQWEAIQIPVGMVFFFFNSALDRVVAFYPSPAGATESLLPLGTWERLIKSNPLLADLEADVEALLVNRREQACECFIVPIDAAYELVGLVKLHWKGFDGGEEARRQIDAFFSRVRDKCRVVTFGDLHG
jgi:hypothetical protein